MFLTTYYLSRLSKYSRLRISLVIVLLLLGTQLTTLCKLGSETGKKDKCHECYFYKTVYF